MAGHRVLQALRAPAPRVRPECRPDRLSHISDGGRFTRHFTPQAGQIGAGTWKVVARLRCESGKDGSPNFITRKRTLKIKP